MDALALAAATIIPELGINAARAVGLWVHAREEYMLTVWPNFDVRSMRRRCAIVFDSAGITVGIVAGASWEPDSGTVVVHVANPAEYVGRSEPGLRAIGSIIDGTFHDVVSMVAANVLCGNVFGVAARELTGSHPSTWWDDSDETYSEAAE